MDNHKEDVAFKAVKCGICSGIVSDRGLLDCCSDLFCFSCIDNWATVTNACPLCKAQFKFVTLVSTGVGNGDENSDNCQNDTDKEDRDVSCDAEIFPFSFPSCFIDEEAVLCLDGDGCKVRARAVDQWDVFTDTSVACDSCDRWYHAYCVGFTASEYSEGTWFCPRCHDSDLGKESVASEKIEESTKELGSSGAITVTEAGETAIVVSNSEEIAVNNNDKTCDIIMGDGGANETIIFPLSTVELDDGTSVELVSEKTQNIVQSIIQEKIMPQHVSMGKLFVSQPDDTGTQLSGKDNDGCASLTMKPSIENKYEDDVAILDSIVGTSSPSNLEVGTSSKKNYGGDLSADGSQADGLQAQVRTRTIMWRGGKENDGSSMVGQLQQQLRSAVGYGASEDLGNVAISDDMFLSAFKEAIATSRKEEPRKFNVMKMQSSRTGVREKLKKKLYAGGISKMKWDRDWNIAFWRQKAVEFKTGKKDAERRKHDVEKLTDMVEDDVEAPDPILSRLYIADNSLLPRNEGTLPEVKRSHQGLGNSICNKNTQIKPEHGINAASASKFLTSLKELPLSAASVKMEGIKDDSKISVDETHENFVHSSVENKRKRAMELLARKQGKTVVKELSKDNKGNFLLLDQLPREMKPVVDHIARSKVPVAVRQIQLDRLVEYHLKKAKIMEVGKNADSEIAVARAVSQENEIYLRSNSKGVYLNLCVQALSKRKAEAMIDMHDKVIGAWRETGLISDSPPGSPVPEALQEGTFSSLQSQDHFGDDDAQPATCISRGSEPKLDELYMLSNNKKLKLSEDDCENKPYTCNVAPEQDNDKKFESNSSASELGRQAGTVDSSLIAVNGSEASETTRDKVDSQQIQNDSFSGAFKRASSDGSKGESIEEQRDDVHPAGSPILLQQMNANIDGTEAHSEEISFDNNRPSNNDDPSLQKMSVQKQVEIYVKEHIRPLYRSGVITAEQYKMTVGKTASKVMQHHEGAVSAEFLIVEGTKVKKLADQYLRHYTNPKKSLDKL